MSSIEGHHWVTSFLKSGILGHQRSPFLASIIKAGLVLNIYLSILLLLRGRVMPNSVIMSYICSYIWMNIGLFLIWYFEQRCLPAFAESVEYLLLDKARAHNILSASSKCFRQWSFVAALPWALFHAIVWGFTSVSTDTVGVFGLSDPLWWISVIIAFWGGILTGIGFFGVIIAIVTISRTSTCRMQLEPLHVDNHAGLGCFGKFAIQTTLMFSSGSLFLPLLIVGIGSSDEMVPCVWLTLCTFSTFVALSFFAPIYIVHASAEKMKSQIVSELVQRFRRLAANLIQETNESKPRVAQYGNLILLYCERWRYDHIRLYPVNVDTITKLGISIILPFVLFFLNKAF